ncbi:protein of unknown function (plasmid) [Caballeronia sp. S22]
MALIVAFVPLCGETLALPKGRMRLSQRNTWFAKQPAQFRLSSLSAFDVGPPPGHQAPRKLTCSEPSKPTGKDHGKSA